MILALEPRFGIFLDPQRCLLWLLGWKFWANFEILGGLVTYNSRHAYQNPNIKSHVNLGMLRNKGSSAWVEARANTLPPNGVYYGSRGQIVGRFLNF